jgi:hypothetical protein
VQLYAATSFISFWILAPPQQKNERTNERTARARVGWRCESNHGQAVDRQKKTRARSPRIAAARTPTPHQGDAVSNIGKWSPSSSQITQIMHGLLSCSRQSMQRTAVTKNNPPLGQGTTTAALTVSTGRRHKISSEPKTSNKWTSDCGWLMASPSQRRLGTRGSDFLTG